MRCLSCLIVLLAACVACADPPNGPGQTDALQPGHITASLGKREVILDSGQHGLKYFPDECLAFVQTAPQVRLLMAAGVSTYLLEGRDMKSLVPRGAGPQAGRTRDRSTTAMLASAGLSVIPAPASCWRSTMPRITKECRRSRAAFPASIAALPWRCHRQRNIVSQTRAGHHRVASPRT